MASMEDGLSLSPGTLVARCERTASETRLNRYPPTSLKKPASGNVRRTWRHADFGIITLLFQDSAGGGVELEDREHPGTFVSVTPTPEGRLKEMIMNIRNTFQRWTNDVITAGLHQATAPPAWKASKEAILPERHSCVFYFKARRDVSVGPLPEFASGERDAMYDEVTALEYQQRMTKELYRLKLWLRESVYVMFVGLYIYDI